MTSLTSNKYNSKRSGSFLFSARVTVVSELETVFVARHDC